MRFARRADRNQKEIAAALRATGASVVSLHTVGGGCPDLLVGRGGVTYLLEVKAPGRVTHERKVGTRAKQQEFRDAWRGGPVHVVTTTSEAFDVVVHGLPPKRDPGDKGEDGHEDRAGE